MAFAQPRQLNYSTIAPAALNASSAGYNKVNPMGALPTNIQGNEWITWTFQDERAFLDPYSLYVRFDCSITDVMTPDATVGSILVPSFDNSNRFIDTTTGTRNVDALGLDYTNTGPSNAGFHLIPNYADGTCKQLDGSGQSLIAELSVSSNSEVIQRKYDYDMEAHLYNILGYDPYDRIQRRHEGMGGLDMGWMAKTHSYASNKGGHGTNLFTARRTANQADNNSRGRNYVTAEVGAGVSGASYVGAVGGPLLYPAQYYVPGAVNNGVEYDVMPNSLGFTAADTANPGVVVWNNGSTKNISLQPRNYVVREILGKDYTHSPQTAWMRNDYNTAFFNQNSTLDPAGQSLLVGIQSYPKFSGYECPYSQAFCYPAYEPILSLDTPQKMIYGGYPECKYRVSRESIYVPLICILSIEWQPEDYMLLPMWAFGRIDLMIRLSPYAFFTSHPNYSRRYNVERAELNFDTYIFNDDVTNTVRNLTSGPGIMMHKTSFKEVIRDEYPGNSMKQYYQITEGCTSAKFLLFCWIPKDYESYSNCRKRYFVNPLLAEYFVSIGQATYPSKTVVGFASNRGTDNVSEMYVQSMKTFGKAWTRSKHMMGIQNFCICDRYWDPTATAISESRPLAALITPQTNASIPANVNAQNILIPNLQSRDNAKVNNAGTSNTLGWWHENRIIGTCLFGIDFETFDRDGGVMSGVNTRNVGTFTLNIKQKLTDGNQDNTEHDIGYTDTTLQMYAWLFIDEVVELHTGRVIIRQ